MRTRQATQLAKLRAVQAFLDDNAERLPGVHANNARRRFDEFVATLISDGMQQERNRVASATYTRRGHALRTALLQHHVAPIVAVAHSVLIKDLFLEPVRMPRGNPSPQQLVSIVRGLALVVREHEREFIAAGLPADFLARMDDAMQAMVDAEVAQITHRKARVGITRGIAVRLVEAHGILRVLGTLVRAEAAHDTGLIECWNMLAEGRRVGRRSPKALAALSSPQATRRALPSATVRLLTSGAEPSSSTSSTPTSAVAAIMKPLRRLFRAS